MATTTSEKVDEFLFRFNQIKSSLNDKLSGPKSDSQSDLSDIISELKTLKEHYQEEAAILPSYTQKRSLETIRSLEEQISELKKAQRPVKKFTFKRSAKEANQQKFTATIVAKDETDQAAHDTQQSQDDPDDIFDLRVDETIILGPDETDGKQVSVAHARNCTITIGGAPRTAQLRHLIGCEAVCGPVSSSIAVHEARDSTLRLMGQQIRLTDCHSCHLFVYVTTRIAIECCTDLTFSPLPRQFYESEAWTDSIARSRLVLTENNWRCVDDFDWQLAMAAAVPEQQPEDSVSPNFRLVE